MNSKSNVVKHEILCRIDRLVKDYKTVIISTTRKIILKGKMVTKTCWGFDYTGPEASYHLAGLNFPALARGQLSNGKSSCHGTPKWRKSFSMNISQQLACRNFTVFYMRKARIWK